MPSQCSPDAKVLPDVEEAAAVIQRAYRNYSATQQRAQLAAVRDASLAAEVEGSMLEERASAVRLIRLWWASRKAKSAEVGRRTSAANVIRSWWIRSKAAQTDKGMLQDPSPRGKPAEVRRMRKKGSDQTPRRTSADSELSHAARIVQQHEHLQELELIRHKRIQDEARRRKRRKRRGEMMLKKIFEEEEKLQAERREREEEIRSRRLEQHQQRFLAKQERQKETELRDYLAKQTLQHVMKPKPLHVVYEERAALVQAREEDERRQKLMDIHEQRKARDLRAELAEHEERYRRKKESEKRFPDLRDWKAPSPSYYVGKSHQVVNSELEEMRQARVRKQEEIGIRRRRMHTFAEQVKCMYAPRQHGKLPPITPSPSPTAQQWDEKRLREKGNEYMRKAKERAKPLKDKKSEEQEEFCVFKKPERLPRDELGNAYLEDAKKAAKPLESRKKQLTEEEKYAQLRQLRKKACRLAAEVSPKRRTSFDSEPLVEQETNQHYFAAIAAKMDLLRALQQN